MRQYNEKETGRQEVLWTCQSRACYSSNGIGKGTKKARSSISGIQYRPVTSTSTGNEKLKSVVVRNDRFILFECAFLNSFFLLDMHGYHAFC